METTATKPVPFTDYPFPLANGQVGSLYLPVRIERADAERLAEYVLALVVDADG